MNGLVLFSMKQKGKTTVLYRRKVSRWFIRLQRKKTRISSDGTTVRYFSCNDNHGLYVRAGQIESILNDAPTNLTRSGSNPSIKPQITAPSPTPSGIPAKAKPTGLRAPTANAPVRPSGSKSEKNRRSGAFLRRSDRKSHFSLIYKRRN